MKGILTMIIKSKRVTRWRVAWNVNELPANMGDQRLITSDQRLIANDQRLNTSDQRMITW